MAKTLMINLNTTTESRGSEMSVKQALDYIEGLKTNDEGEALSLATLAEEAIIYAARRMMALAKDQARIGKGKAPSRIYTPRVADVKDAARTAEAVKADARVAFARILHMERAPKPPKAKPPKAKPQPAKLEAPKLIKAKPEAPKPPKAKPQPAKLEAPKALTAQPDPTPAKPGDEVWIPGKGWEEST